MRITTPGGQVEAQISLLHGVMPGVIAIEHGYGHKEMGAARHTLDGEPMAFDKKIKSGINLNDLGFAGPNPTGSQHLAGLGVGSAVRQGLPARIERV